MLESVILGHCSPFMLDIGCGRGRSTFFVEKVCVGEVVGVDIDCSKLRRINISSRSMFVCADSSQLPFRSKVFGLITVIYTLHEVSEDSIENVLEEIYRVLEVSGTLIVVDKVALEGLDPPERLTLLTEEAYHKALEYTGSPKVWGIKSPGEVLKKIESHGFKVEYQRIMTLGKWIHGKRFLREWGRDTMRLLNQISDNRLRGKVEDLVKEIKRIACEYGYGPTKVLVSVFKKT